jgi:hypothetical protein
MTSPLYEIAKDDLEGAIKFATTIIRICTAIGWALGVGTLFQIGSYTSNREVLTSPWLFSLSITLTILLFAAIEAVLGFRSNFEKDRAELMMHRKS